MAYLRLSEKMPSILAFDGKVLECFFDEGGSRRVHVAHIKTITLDPSAKDGKHLLTIMQKYDPMLLWVDEAMVPKVTELIGAIRKAMEKPEG